MISAELTQELGLEVFDKSKGRDSHGAIVERDIVQAKSKAIFDTGSSAYLAISPQDYEGTNRASGIGMTVSDYGFLGQSLGGQSPNRKQLQAELKTFSIGKL
jgi:hypothetical protein